MPMMINIDYGLRMYDFSVLDFDSKHFWNWTAFSSYVQFMLLFCASGGLFTYILLNQSVFIESLGFLALICEAMLGVPQFYKNFQNRSTKGMRSVLNILATF